MKEQKKCTLIPLSELNELKERIKELEADHTLEGYLNIYLTTRGYSDTFTVKLEQFKEGTLQLSTGSLERIRKILHKVAQESYTAGQQEYKNKLKKSSLLTVLKFKWQHKDSLNG